MEKHLLLYVSCFIILVRFGYSEEISWITFPQNISALQGQTVSFQCRIRNREDRSILWFRRSENKVQQLFMDNSTLTFDERLYVTEFADGFDLFISNVSISDDASYGCSVSRSNLRHVARLAVIVPPTNVQLTKNNSELNEDELLELKCQAEGGNPSPNIIWTRNGEVVYGAVLHPAETKFGVVFSTLILKLSSSDHKANFNCLVFNDANRDEPLTDSIILFVQYAPIISMSYYNPLNVIENSTVVIWCNISSNPSVKETDVSLMSNGQTLGIGFNHQLNSIKRNDSGIFVCSAQNSMGKRVVDVRLNVQYHPTIDIVSSTHSIVSNILNVDEGENIELNCEVDSNPPILREAIWSHDENILTIDEIRNNFRNITRYIAGNYTCSAFNMLTPSNGEPNNQTSSQSVLVNVAHIPDVDKTRTMQLFDLNSSIVVTCRAKCYPQCNFSWFHNSTPLMESQRIHIDSEIITSSYYSDQSNLSIDRLHEDDIGLYKCVATNRIGYDSYSTIVYLTSTPEKPDNISVMSKTWCSIFLKWSAGFDGGHEQTFYVEVQEANSTLSSKEFSSEDHLFNLTNLKPSTEYLISIQGENIKGRSVKSTIITVTTKDYIWELSSKIEFDKRRNILFFRNFDPNYCVDVDVLQGEKKIHHLECETILTGMIQIQSASVDKIYVSFCLVSRPQVCNTKTIVYEAKTLEKGGIGILIIALITVGIALFVIIFAVCVLFICRKKTLKKVKQPQQRKKAPDVKNTNFVKDCPNGKYLDAFSEPSSPSEIYVSENSAVPYDEDKYTDLKSYLPALPSYSELEFRNRFFSNNNAFEGRDSPSLIHANSRPGRRSKVNKIGDAAQSTSSNQSDVDSGVFVSEAPLKKKKIILEAIV